MKDKQENVFISSLSEAQLNDIMKDKQEDYALFYATSTRNPNEITRFLVAKEIKQEMMERLKIAYTNELITLVPDILHFFVFIFYRFDELF